MATYEKLLSNVTELLHRIQATPTTEAIEEITAWAKSVPPNATQGLLITSSGRIVGKVKHFRGRDASTWYCTEVTEGLDPFDIKNMEAGYAASVLTYRLGEKVISLNRRQILG